MLEDFGPEIAALKTGDYTVTRRVSNSIINGRLAASANTTLQIEAMVHPTTGADVRHLPEGQRGAESRALYTTTQLLGAGALAPDRVAIDGLTFEVAHVEAWAQLGNFYRVVLVRVGL